MIHRALAVLIGISILLSGCLASAPVLPAAIPATPSATVRPLPTLTPWSTKTPRPTRTPTPRPPLCWKTGGQVVEDAVASELLGTEIPLLVYLPPCYDELPDLSFPVAYLFHGQGYDQTQWLRLGLNERLDYQVAVGQSPPFILVLPGIMDWDSPTELPFARAVVEEIIPHIESRYRAQTGREDRKVGGISRGASWALHLGLNYPELFAAVGGHSLPIFYEDGPRVSGWLDAISPELMPALYLDYAASDQSAIRRSVNTLMAQLDERGIAYTFSTAPGAHDETYWGSQIELYLDFYGSDWMD
jgi:enterochelin esterase-like enzyme